MNAPQDFRNMTADTIGKDLLQALVMELKLLPEPWPKLSKKKQDDIIDRLRNRVEIDLGKLLRKVETARLMVEVAEEAKALVRGLIARHGIACDLRPGVISAACRASEVPPRLDTMLPQWSVLQARHEHQYSRLFRS